MNSLAAIEMRPAVGLVLAAIMLVLGIRQLIWPAKATGRSIANHQKLLEDRLKRGSDAYFEELRALKAYDPSRPDQQSSRYWGLLPAGLGGAMLILFFSQPNILN